MNKPSDNDSWDWNKIILSHLLNLNAQAKTVHLPETSGRDKVNRQNEKYLINSKPGKNT